MVLFLPLQKRFKLRLVPRHTGCLIAANQLQHMTVVIRNDLLEIRDPLVEVLQDLAGLFGTGRLHVAAQELLQAGDILLLRDRLDGDKLLVDAQVELMLGVEHVGDATQNRSPATPEMNALPLVAP